MEGQPESLSEIANFRPRCYHYLQSVIGEGTTYRREIFYSDRLLIYISLCGAGQSPINIIPAGRRRSAPGHLLSRSPLYCQPSSPADFMSSAHSR